MKHDYDPNADLLTLLSHIRKLSKPCDKLFGWVPSSLLYIVGIPIFVLGVFAARAVGIEFKKMIFWIFSLRDYSGGTHEDFGFFCVAVGFIISGYVLKEGIYRMDEKAAEKFNARNKQKIIEIERLIKLREKNSHLE
jgi:hypothetical protein